MTKRGAYVAQHLSIRVLEKFTNLLHHLLHYLPIKMIKILFVCHGSMADSRELAALVRQDGANRGNGSGRVLRLRIFKN